MVKLTSTRQIGIVGEEKPRMNAECVREIMDMQQGQIDMSVFDLAEIGLGNARFLGQGFLRHRPLDPEARDIASDQRANIHKRNCRAFARPSLFVTTNMRAE
jgi:hypothetical protein